MNQKNAQRLLDVATANRESKFADRFTMLRYGYDCGTPACAMGNYAVRRDLQRKFSLSNIGHLLFEGDCGLGFYVEDETVNYFGISEDERFELFESNGCGNAKTPIQAAKYIENFLDNKGWTF